MNILLVVGVGAALLFIGSRIYPFWIARIFDEDDTRPTPAEQFADGREYVKTPTPIVFAHHFASIAGAGPIVGPIIALAFGWGPAWVWIIIGGIFYGAVQDMSAMFVSVREGGKTIAEIARRTLGKGGFFLFVAFLLLVISVVNAVFLKFSAGALTSSYPLDLLGLEPGQTLLAELDKDGVTHGRIGGIATTSVIIMTLAAPVLGLLVRRARMKMIVVFPIAVAVCVLSVVVGFAAPVPQITPNVWMIILAVYTFIACWVPVWLLLQPRDLMNVQLLYGGLILLLVGTIAAGFGDASVMQMPMNRIAEGTSEQGPFWPIMFITIACGAISGFHSLVATGTTVKQIPRESDCRRVGYNAMILESLLALLVLTAVASQMDYTEYATNMSAPAGAIQTFAIGCGHLFTHVGIDMAIGSVFGILIIEGFLITTLDTSVRLARYLFEELWGCLFGENVPKPLRSTFVNTACAILMMLLFAYSKTASDALWQYFGAGNQLIGALALTTVAIWLMQRRRNFWFAAVPAVFMIVTAVAALAWKIWDQYEKSQSPITIGAGALLLVLAIGFIAIATTRVVGVAKHEQPSD